MTSPGDKGIPKFHSILYVCPYYHDMYDMGGWNLPLILSALHCREERCEKFLSSLYFTDTNLHGIQWNWSRPVDSISTWKVPENWPTVDSESAKVFRPGGQRILFQDLPPESKFQQAKLGDTFGPSWSTYWFIIRVCYNVLHHPCITTQCWKYLCIVSGYYTKIWKSHLFSLE